jgi:SpoVK/Ycf46/Vps4 family AAA+-type ATPase
MSKSTKPFLDAAIVDISRAVECDKAGEYEEALEKYKKGSAKFLHVIKYENNVQLKRIYEERLTGYLTRAEVLAASLEAAKKPGGAHGSSAAAVATAGQGGATGASAAAAAAAAEEEAEDDDDFDLATELEKRVGMAEVKRQVMDLQHTLLIDKRRKEANPEYKADGLHMHMVFKGPPGCGKTSMARLLARSLKSLGVLKRGHLVEVQRSDLVAGFVGQTALRTREVVNSAKGGVLFIDECYRLKPPTADTSRDFGTEAIDEFMMPMETGDPVMIFAGYNDSQMDSFIAANPGLFRRINYTFVFDSYAPSELAQILLIKIRSSGFSVESALGQAEALGRLIESRTTAAQRERMNGGICDHILRNAKRHLDRRLTLDSPAESLMLYTAEDIAAACAACPVPPPIADS